MLDVSFTAEDIVDDFAAFGNRRILAIRIDCNKKKKREREIEKEKKKRKALFYCGTEINTLKFRHILQIQLRTQLTVLRV